MKFGFCGVNYTTAKLDIRDEIVFTESKKLELLRKLSAKEVHQCMILSTCNRSEIYYCFEEEAQKEQVKTLFQETFPDIEFLNVLEECEEKDAITHLFFVTAGLKSLVLGEDQILGQVKDAFDFSRTMGYSGKELNKIVRDAITCAKQIKKEMKISEVPLSVSYVGIKLLEKKWGIENKKVLIIGSGQTASLALRYVYAAQAAEIILCNRTYANAKNLKEELPDIQIREFEERYECMRDCDIVISATSSPHLVIRKERCHFHHQMVFLDLATPRDIEKSIGDEINFDLIDMDVLEEMARENRKEREELASESKKIIEEKVDETMEWLFRSSVDVTIESLQQKCEEIVSDGYEYLNHKLELSEREQKIVRRTLHATLKRLLREPVLELKNLENEQEQEKYKKMVERLFQIASE